MQGLRTWNANPNQVRLCSSNRAWGVVVLFNDIQKTYLLGNWFQTNKLITLKPSMVLATDNYNPEQLIMTMLRLSSWYQTLTGDSSLEH